MAIPKAQPLFPTLDQFKQFDWDEYPDLKLLIHDAPAWRLDHWNWAKDFLLYIGRNKSDHTFTRFRSEIEKFLLWAFLVKDQPIDQMKKTDILEYADFSNKPPQSWICLANAQKFVLRNGQYHWNKKWAPYRYISSTETADKKKYRPSQQSLHAMFTAVSVFYKFLMDEEKAYGDPSAIAKKDCKLLIRDSQVKNTRRLDQEQWDFLLRVATEMADADSKYERNLFLIASMKTLFLRISEFSERKDWIPVMSHFWQDSDHNWWLKIYGKGRKLRDISVPDSFLSYLARYRESRGLPKLPGQNEKLAIIEKLRGVGGMTSRQLARMVDEVLDHAAAKLETQVGKTQAQIFKEATTHWLRHTGASFEIDRGRALKDVSEDLGHASMATTDTVYVQTVAKNRARSGKDRKV